MTLKSQPVELVQIIGDDLTPAMAAWYSTRSELTDERIARLPPMLQMLALGDAPEHLPHTVPFEHTLLSFRVTSEISTHIHFLKHRIGTSISSQSMRYMTIKDYQFYVPGDWPESVQKYASEHMKDCFQLYLTLIEDLTAAGFSRKRVKESARLVLPYGTQIRYLVTFNLLSFIHFLRLRKTTHAQREIDLIATEMLSLVEKTERFPTSLSVWGF